MPVLAHVPNGKVVALWGTAILVAPDGSERPLKVGDVVHQGDRIVTSQNGIVEIRGDGSEPQAAAPRTAETVPADVERVIAQIDQPLEFEAPAAGLAGGDGSMTPGLRVERVAESVASLAGDTAGATPAAIGNAEAGDATTAIQGEVNTAPSADDASASTAEDTPVTGVVNAIDLNGDTLAFGIGQAPANGAVTVDATGRWTYTPAADYNGSDRFVITVSDGKGGTATSTILVAVAPVNDLPEGADVSRTIAEDGAYTVSAADLGFSDVDSGSALQGVRIDTLPTAGTLLLDGVAISAGAVVSAADIAAGKLVFQPAANANGSPYGAFTFSVQDDAGAFDATPNTFTLNVTPVNDAPVITDPAADAAGNYAVTTDEDTPLDGRVIANDLDGDALSYAKGSDPAHGTVTVRADGTWTYTPAPNYNGPDSFTVTVSDGHGGTASSTITVGVTPVNDLPDSASVSRTVAEDNSYTLTSADFAFNDADAGSSLQGVRIDTLPTAGSLLLNGVALAAGTVVSAADIAAGKLVFQPAANANGTPYGAFTFSVQDDAGGFDATPNTFTLNVTAVNDLPDSADVTRTVAEDSGYTVTAADFAFNDVDAGSALAAVRIDSLPTGGSLLLNGTALTAGTVVSLADITAGKLVFQPAANANGSPYGSFTFSVQDDTGGFAASPSTFTLNVTPVNDAPVISDPAADPVTGSYSVTTAEDTPVSGQVIASDIDGDALGYALAQGPANGSVVLNTANGTWTYTPAADYSGPDSFTVTVSDGNGGTATSVVSIGVIDANDLPSSADVSRTVAEDTSYTLTSADFAFNDADAGSSLQGVRIDTLPTAGSLLLNGVALAAGTVVSATDIAAGKLVFQPVANANGSPYGAFTFSVQDDAGTFGASPNTFTLSVTPVNDAPVITDPAADPLTGNYAVTTLEDTPVSGRIVASDADGDRLTYVIESGVSHGSLLLNTVTGAWTYTPSANYNGPDSFAIAVFDRSGAKTVSTVSVGVTPVNDLPSSADVSRTVAEDTSYTLTPADFAFNDADAGASLQGVRIDTLPTAGTLLLNGVALAAGTVVSAADIAAGKLVFQPVADANGSPYGAFTFSVQDDAGSFGASPNTFTLSVTPVNDAPVTSDWTHTVAEDQSVSGQVVATDFDYDRLTYSIKTGVSHGSLLLNTVTGTYTYTPAQNYSGTDRFTIAVSDGKGGTVDSVITINVTPVNDLPSSADVSRTVAEDTSYTLTPADFAFNDADAGASLQGVRIDTLPTAGTLLLNGVALAAGTVVSAADIAAGKLVFQPVADANGSPYGAFTFSVQDDAGSFGASPNTFTLSVTPVNDAPVTSDWTHTVAEDQSVSGQVVATDFDYDRLTYSIKTGVSHGSLLLNTVTGTYTYTPAQNYSGTDRFTIAVSDGKGGTVDSVITINVTPVNDLPSSADVSRTVAEDNSYTLTSADFAFNDVDAGSSLQGVRIDTLPTAGSLLLDGVAISAGAVVSAADIAAGKLVFQPVANANGSPYGAFTFSVQDDAGTFDASPNTFTLNVTPVNDAPVITDPAADPLTGNYAVTTLEDTPVSGRIVASDADGDRLTYVIESGVSHGSLLLNTVTGAWTYTPSANYNGPDSFAIAVFDPSGAKTVSTVAVGVTPVNDLPSSADVSRTVAEDTSYTLTSADFAFNDVDAGSSLTAVRIETLPAAGTLLLNGTAVTAGTVISLADITAGRLVMQPAANANGSPYGSFTFSVQDNAGGFDATPNTFTLNVTAVNDAPVATGGAVTGTEDIAVVFSWAQFNVSDVDSASSSLGVQISSLPTDGKLQVWSGTAWVDVTLNQTVSQATIAAGNLRFVPDANESGANAFPTSGTGNLRSDYASFDYRPTDGSATGAAATMRVDITPVADAPTLTTANHSTTLFTTSWETSDTGLTQGQLNPNTTSTDTLSQTTLAGWTRVDTPDVYSGGTNRWELWSNGDTQQNAAGNQTAISAGTGNGSNWLELNNASNNVQTLGIQRTVTTTAGYVYDLSLDYAGRLGFSQDYTRIAVLVDGVEVASYAGTSSNSALNWETLHFSFVGTGTAQTIRIVTDASAFNSSGRGAMIDDIKLVESQGALAGNAAGGTKTEIALSGYITTGLADTDGSESLTLAISGLPTGATVVTASAPGGLPAANGTVTMSAADLASAKLQLGSSYTGDVALTVTATSTEPNGSTASTTQGLNFKVLVGAGDVGVEGSGTHTLEASTTALSTATGLHGEYFGYNETANPGSAYNVQTGDGSVGNLDSLADITSIINTRAGTTLVGTAQSASAAAADAGWVADNIEYGVNPTVTANLGANSSASAGASITSGALWRFLGGSTSGSDAASLDATSSFGQTTDSILRMVGSAYFNAGSYDFQVRADDGFSLRIDGQVVLQFDGNQSATTRATTTPVTLSEGFHTIEILYWEQGQVAVLDMDYRPTGTTAWLDFSTDNLALFQPGSTPTLTELQDVIEDPSNNGQYLVRTGQEAWGGATADTITGSAGRDIIHGGAGNDTISGGSGADRIEGGAGNDTLTGDVVGSPFADVFAWSLGDAGTAGSGRAVDTITDFNTAARAAGGDVLDLRDLLQGEKTTGGVGNLGQYLDIDTSGSDTVIRISSSGNFAGGTYAAGSEDQRIVLTGVNLRTDMGLAASATDNQVIQELLNRGKLLVDNT
ncbi:MAG: tandem-95 repeat protein [Pseudomonadota bacterium]